MRELANPKDLTEGVIIHKNKNRGAQVVKLHVPFLFFFVPDAVPNAPCTVPEATEQTMLPLPVEKREWNGGIGVCVADVPPRQTRGFAEALAQAFAFWYNVVRFV